MLRKLRTTINSSSFSTLETDISSIPVANLSTFALSPQIFPAYILLHLYPPTSWKSRAFLNPVSCANAQTNNKNYGFLVFTESFITSLCLYQTNKQDFACGLWKVAVYSCCSCNEPPSVQRNCKERARQNSLKDQNVHLEQGEQWIGHLSK